MSEIYLCPHCRVRNTVVPGDTEDGVVSCHACYEDFLLPQFASKQSETTNWDETAIVDTRNHSLRETDTEIIDPAPGPLHAPTEKELDPGFNHMSAEPTMVTSLADTPTVISTEEMIVAGTVTDFQIPTNNVAPTDQLVEKEPPEARRDTQKDVRPSDSLNTEPVPFLMDGNELGVDDDVLNRPLSDTTVRVVGRRRAPIIAGAVMLISVVVIAAFQFINSRFQESEVTLFEWSKRAAIERSKTLDRLLVGHMAAGRPDMARAGLQSLADAGRVAVLRPDGKQAFVQGDWSTYRRIMSRVCGDEAPPAIRTRWFAAGDSRIASMGPTPCEEIEMLGTGATSEPTGIPNDLIERFSGPTPPPMLSWIETKSGRREFGLARPVYGNDSCATCHEGRPETEAWPLLGVVVVRTDMYALDAIVSERRRLIWIVGGGSVALIVLILAASIRWLARVEELV